MLGASFLKGREGEHSILIQVEHQQGGHQLRGRVESQAQEEHAGDRGEGQQKSPCTLGPTVHYRQCHYRKCSPLLSLSFLPFLPLASL